jgi:hypothetical protein
VLLFTVGDRHRDQRAGRSTGLLLDRLTFCPALRADRAALRGTEAALPLRSDNALDQFDETPRPAPPVALSGH